MAAASTPRFFLYLLIYLMLHTKGVLTSHIKRVSFSMGPRQSDKKQTTYPRQPLGLWVIRFSRLPAPVSRGVSCATTGDSST